jgi:hypothetical protein
LLPHVLEFRIAVMRFGWHGLVRVGDAGGFTVGGGEPRALFVVGNLHRRGVGAEDAKVAGEPRLRVGGVAVAELAGTGVEFGGDFAGDGWGAGGGSLGPCGVLPGDGEVEALEASAEDARDRPGAVERGAGDLGNYGADVVPG